MTSYVKGCEVGLEWKKSRQDHVLRRHGLSANQARHLYLIQGGVCAICRRSADLVVDHCHSSKAMRGLLCGTCNTALGGFRDDIPTILRAIEYLQSDGWLNALDTMGCA